MSDLVGNPEDRFLELHLISMRERGGVVVERRTTNREVLGSIPTSGTVLCH